MSDMKEETPVRKESDQPNEAVLYLLVSASMVVVLVCFLSYWWA